MLSLQIYNRLSLLLVVTLAVGLLSAGMAVAGDPFSFSGNWDYQKNGGGETDSSRFVENYNLIYNKDLSAAMAFNGSVRYSKSNPSNGANTSVLSPTLGFDLRNDLFALNLNASETRNEQSDSATRTTDTWGANLSSSLEDWPSFRLYYSQTNSTDDASPAELDNESTSLGGSVEYSFEYIDLLYDVRASESTNNLTRSENSSLDQSAQVTYQQSFWRGRLTVSASQQYQVSNSDQKRVVGAGNVVPVELNFPTTQQTRFYQLDNNPVTAALGTQTFQGVNLLSTTTAQNMARLVNGQSYELIEVFLYRDDPVTGRSALTLSQLAQLSVNTWRVYRKNSLALPWQNIAATTTVENSRTIVEPDGTLSTRTVIQFALPVVQSSTYVKVVADVNNTFGDPALVDDIMVYRNVTSPDDVFTQSTQTTNLQTQLNTMFRVTDKWSASYNLRRAESRLEDGKTIQLSQSLNNTYTPSEKLGFSLGFSQNNDQQADGTESTNRSYSLSTTMLPLPTVSVSMGYTRSETDQDGGQSTVSDAINSSVNASIYPDLTASLTANWSQTQASGEAGKSDTYGLNAYTTAYLTPRLDLTTTLGYSESNTGDGTTTTDSTYGVNLGFRPSDILLMNFNADGDFDGESMAFGSTANLLWTRKLQSQFGLTYDLGDEESQQYNAQLSWAMNQNVSFKSNANYLDSGGEKTWNVNLNASVYY